MSGLFRNFLEDERGATAIEYGLIASLVFMGTVGAIQVFAGKTTDMYNRITAKM